MDDLYNKKNQYERMIRILNANYNKLNSCSQYLKKCRKNMNDTLKINDECYSKEDIDEIIKKIDNNVNMIINTILPQARYQYNNILYEISKM